MNYGHIITSEYKVLALKKMKCIVFDKHTRRQVLKVMSSVKSVGQLKPFKPEEWQA